MSIRIEHKVNREPLGYYGVLYNSVFLIRSLGDGCEGALVFAHITNEMGDQKSPPEDNFSILG